MGKIKHKTHISVIISRSSAMKGAQTEICVIHRRRNTDTQDGQTKAVKKIDVLSFPHFHEKNRK
jgi:hypothetical protein